MNNSSNQLPASDCQEQKKIGFSECIYAWICVIVGYLFCRAYPPSEYPMGMFIVFILAIGCGCIILIDRGVTARPQWIISAIISAVFAAVPIFSAEFAVQFFSFCVSVIAYCYFIYAATENCLEKGFSNFIIFDFVNAVLLFPMHSFGRIFPAMFSGKKRGFKLALKVVLGLIAGIIPTAIVVSLLAYDEKFSKIMESVLEFFENFDIFSHFVSLFLGVFIAILLFGLYCSSVEHSEDKIKKESFLKTLIKLRIIPCITICAALLPLVAVYGIFFFSQLEYYISAFTGVLPDGLIYSTYAREGFFQLCQVSGINLALVIAVSVLSHRNGKFNNVFLKTVKILFSVITLVLIATAMSKMALYIRTYGLTEKRILSTWLMIVIALVFILIIIKQFVPKLKVIAASVCVATVMFALLAFSNYGAIIANHNVDRYISGDLTNVDIYTLTEIGEPAVPAMAKLAEHYKTIYGYETEPEYKYSFTENEYQHYTLVSSLREYRNMYESNNSIFSFSVSRSNAEKSIDEYFN